MEKYTSKTKRNECKNEGCSKKRQDGSSRCIKCAEEHKKIISEYMRELGNKGGNALKNSKPPDYYQKISAMGNAKKAELKKERENAK